MNDLQTSIFDPPDEIRHPAQNAVGQHRTNGPQTSIDAAKAIRPESGKQRMAVLSLLVDSGDVGMTRHEIAHFGVIALQSVCGRVAELVRADFAWVSKNKRRQGRSIVFATERGRKKAVGC